MRTPLYSKLVATTRPASAVAIDPRANTPFSQLAVSRPAATPARGRGKDVATKDVATPRTASELHDLWGRTLDPKFTEHTIAWLAKASQQVTSVRPFSMQYCCSILTPIVLTRARRKGPNSKPLLPNNQWRKTQRF